ncbi:MAG: hypothetical protein C4562_02985 [Actinobacteria bacterium]|nr:MAG: hypothetical protein C4562_02985 [Actinomycetota bacterium]
MAELHANFQHDKYDLRRKVLKLVGGAFTINAADGSLAFYSKMKAFKLKEDIRLYTDKEMTQELLTIQARQILDFQAAYDVVDAVSGEKVGALKRKGLKSLIQDEWIIMDKDDKEIGTISEDSTLMALLRRFLSNLIPQTYDVSVGGQKVAVFKGNFNPFVYKLALDFSGANGQLDRRLGLAAAVLLAAIEGKQN